MKDCYRQKQTPLTSPTTALLDYVTLVLISGAWRLNDHLTGSAAVFGADVAHDAPAHRHDVEHLVRVDTQRAQRTTAIRAGAGTRRWFVNDVLAR